ncbi:hypothetical protein TWF694_009636 [Orbilia ellipsospora]|uniref:F-box domain-containing protein n=1 Tax=Orbilia ellipsospora TaxID=2528407 RepID=A0AAV9XCL2_9PEZI
MAKITSLPPELLAHVASYIDDADDLLSLRLTNCDLNVAARTCHLKALYESVNICIAFRSLENLVEISKHPSGVNRLVRNIKLFSHAPYIRSPPSLKRDGRRGDEEGFSLAHAVYKASEKKIWQLQRPGKKEEPVLDEDMEIGLLTTAFRNFPNLRTLDLDTDNPYPLSRTQFNLFFPSLRMEHGKRIPASFRKAQIACKGIFTYASHYNFMAPMTAAVMSDCSKISTIRQIYDGILGMQMDWFLWPENQVTKSAPVFTNLKILELTVTPDLLKGQLNSIEINKGFYSWIETVGLKLEQLKVIFQYYGSYKDRSHDMYSTALDIPTTLSLPRLKRLHLDWMVFKVEKMIGFLQNVASTLEELELGFCLTANPKNDWWRLLKALNTGFDKMQKFDVFITQEDVSVQPFFLPDILVRGNWASRKATCWVRTPTFPSWIEGGSSNHSRPAVETLKNISEELTKNTEEDSFWESMTEGNWKAEHIIHWEWPCTRPNRSPASIVRSLRSY